LTELLEVNWGIFGMNYDKLSAHQSIVSVSKFIYNKSFVG